MSTDVAVPDSHPQLRTMVKALSVESSFEESNEGPNTFVMDVMEGILTAAESGDFDAIFAAQESGMVNGKDFAGRPFLLKGENISIRKSSPANVEQGGFTHYAIMKVYSLQDGSDVTLNCGGMTFMATLHALRQAGYFLPEKGCPEDGRSLVIIEVPSAQNSFLKLQAFRMPEPPSAAKKSR